eukprot:6199720-Pleurochrysis_carterae.AAC.1
MATCEKFRLEYGAMWILEFQGRLAAMFESLLAWAISRQLRAVLSQFTSANLDIGLHKGALLLQNLELDPELFARLGLPFLVIRASIRRLQLLLPWSSDNNGHGNDEDAPFVLRLEGVHITLGPLMESTSGTDAQKAWLTLHRQRLLGAAGTGAPEQPSASIPPAPPLDASQQRALVDTLLRSLQVFITDVVVRYESSEMGGAAMELRLDSLSLRCQRRGKLPRLLALCFKKKESEEHVCICRIEAVVGTFGDQAVCARSLFKRVHCLPVEVLVRTSSLLLRMALVSARTCAAGLNWIPASKSAAEAAPVPMLKTFSTKAEVRADFPTQREAGQMVADAPMHLPPQECVHACSGARADLRVRQCV